MLEKKIVPSAMLKQLALTTYFLILSCSDLRWNELPSIISKLKGLNLSEEEISEMDYFTRCELRNSNPIVTHWRDIFSIELKSFLRKLLLIDT